MFKAGTFFSVIITAVALSVHCSMKDLATDPSSEIVADRGLSLSIALPCSEEDSLDNAVVIISAEDMDTVKQKLMVEDCTVSGTINNIPAGQNRLIEIKVFTRNGQVAYYGSAIVNIEFNKTIDVQIKLKAMTGSINIIGILCDDKGAFIRDSRTLALYHCDESSDSHSTTLLDETENWNGVLVNGTRCQGAFGNGISFKIGQYSSFDTILPSGLQNGTIELYFRTKSDFDKTGSYLIFGTDGSRCNLYYNKGSLVFMKNHSDKFKFVSAGISIQPNRWYHIAGTWGNKGMRLFVDKALVAANKDYSVYQSSPRETAENRFYCGKKSGCCMEGIGVSEDIGLYGDIDEIRLSDVERY